MLTIIRKGWFCQMNFEERQSNAKIIKKREF
jgi:hypothetical protein